MLDKGVFAIENNLNLIGLEGVLEMDESHLLDQENLEYHKDHIFINYA